MKEKAKFNNDNFLKGSKQTGGGPPPKYLDDRDQAILVIVGDANDPVDNTVDDDTFEVRMYYCTDMHLTYSILSLTPLKINLDFSESLGGCIVSMTITFLIVSQESIRKFH